MVNMRVWRCWLVVVYFALQSITSTAHADEWQEASDVVVKTTDAMLLVLAEFKHQTVPDIAPAIDGVLAPVVDFRAIARGVMAKHYRRAQPEQFETFVNMFRDSLMQAYTRALLSFEVDFYRLQKHSGKDTRAGREKIWVKVYDTMSVYDIHYTMSNKSGHWKVTNVILDGVNLGLAFRHQFAAAMRQYDNNMDAVIANWHTQVD